MTSLKKIITGAAVALMIGGAMAATPAVAGSIADGSIGGSSNANISSSVSKPVYSFRNGGYGYGHSDQRYGGAYGYHPNN